MSPSRTAGVPFDPSDPPRLGRTDGGAGRVVMLSVSPKGSVEPWGLEIATALARTWSGTSAELVLVDASLDAPALSAHLGQEHAHGLAEVLHGTATVQEVVQAVAEERFSLIPAGKARSNANALFTSGSWERSCDTLVRAGVTVLVFTPADAPWNSAIAAKASDVVGIASVDESLPLDAIPSEKLRAVLTPPGSWGEPGTHDIALEDPLGIDPFARAGPSQRASGPLFAADSSPDPTGDPGNRPRPHPGPSSGDVHYSGSRALGRSLLYAAALAAIVVAILTWAGWWNHDSEQPDAAPESSAVRAAPTNEPTSPEAAVVTDSTVTPSALSDDPPPTLEEVGQPAFSIALASYRDPATARRHAERVTALWDTTLVFVTPVDIGGEVFHRVLAGGHPDSLEAESARAHLGKTAGANSDDWVVRPAHLAFELGAWDALSDATAHVERLRTSGIESYFLRDTTSGETERFRVYAGAFGNIEEATTLDAMLRAEDIEATLTDRRGSARISTTK